MSGNKPQNKGSKPKSKTGNRPAPVAPVQSNQGIWAAIIAIAVILCLLIAAVTVLFVNQSSDSNDPNPTGEGPSVQVQQDPEETEQSREDPSATEIDRSGGVIYNPSGKPLEELVVVSIYSDFSCSWCMKLELVQGDMLKKMADAGDIALDYHPLPFLNKDYSARSAAAALAVGTLEVEKLPDFTKALFEETGSTGSMLSDESIAEIARKAGVNERTIGQFADPTYSSMATEGEARAKAEGIEGTPAVYLDGIKTIMTNPDFDQKTADGFREYLEFKVAAKK